MTNGGIRDLKGVEKTHARARWRKGGCKNSYLVRRLFYDYAACKARKASKPHARKTAQGWAQESTNDGEPLLEFRTTSISTPIMENQMDDSMENELETTFQGLGDYIGLHRDNGRTQ